MLDKQLVRSKGPAATIDHRKGPVAADFKRALRKFKIRVASSKDLLGTGYEIRRDSRHHPTAEWYCCDGTDCDHEITTAQER